MSDPWFRFFPSDWISGVSGLSAAERGVYVTLLAMIYDHGKPVRRDDPRLARVCGIPTPGFTRAVDALLDLGKLTEQDGFLFNDRAKNELHDRENRKLMASDSANSRWNKNKQNQRSIDAVALQTHCENDATRARIPQPQPQLGDKSPKEVKQVSPMSEAAKPFRTAKPSADFLDFWKAYPTDPIMSRKEANAVWLKLSPEDRIAARAAIPAFVAHCRANPTYRPVHANRFLSQRRFEGFHGPPQASGGETARERAIRQLAELEAQNERSNQSIEPGRNDAEPHEIAPDRLRDDPPAGELFGRDGSPDWRAGGGNVVRISQFQGLSANAQILEKPFASGVENACASAVREPRDF